MKREAYQGILLGCAVCVILILSASSASALNVQLYRPQTGAVQGDQLFTSETLRKHDFSIGLSFNYVQHPLEVGRFGGNQRRVGIVDRFITGDALASYGATDWLNFSIDIPFNAYHDIAPIFIPTRDQGGPDMGDIMLTAKLRVFDAQATSNHLGLAFVPFLTIPTGRESVYFGDKNVTGGLWLVGDAQWKANRFYLNVGARFRQREQVANLVVKHEFLYGVGFERSIWKRGFLDIIAEVYGSTTFSKFFSEEISSPLQAQLLLRKKWGQQRRLVANLGGGLGITNGYGAPDFRVMTGVGYTFGKKEDQPVEAQAPAPERLVLDGITFGTNSAKIGPGSMPVLQQAIAVIAARPDAGIVVTGYTDDRGNDSLNQTLSQRRAESVKAYFVSEGVEASRITAIGRGREDPIADNATAEGRAKNRRIELKLQ